MAPTDPKQLFLAHLDTVDRIVASLCRRHSLVGDDAADFDSWVKLKLIEDDYAVLRKFRGESSLATYLTVVIAMLFRDYRVQCWGRWRPSAAARQRGPLAIRLETLVYRDGHRLGQAAEILRTAGETDLSDRELAGVLAAVPARVRLRPVAAGFELAADVAAPGCADDAVIDREAEERRRATDQALAAALERLPPEERILLRMRFWEGMSVADIARGLGLPQKPLYHRMHRALADLRELLEESGVSRDHARAVLNEWAS